MRRRSVVVNAGSLSRSAQRGHVRIGGRVLACALGKGGLAVRKREGDGATPCGRYRLMEVLYRADQVRRPAGMNVRRIKPADGWADEPGDRNYNRPVQHPYPASAERLWRDDRLYDLVGVLDYNLRPRVKGRGSAIFVHAARSGYRPTEGCIALAAKDLRRLFDWLAAGGEFVIGSNPRPWARRRF